MFTKADEDEFIKVGKFGDAFIILQKTFCDDDDRHEFMVVKSNFEHSKEFAELKTAKELCEFILELLGVKTYYAESGMGLAIEIISKKKPIGPGDQIAN
jgi:hypothetical protein